MQPFFSFIALKVVSLSRLVQVVLGSKEVRSGVSQDRDSVLLLLLFMRKTRTSTITQLQILFKNLIEQEGNHNALACQLNGAIQRKRERGEEKIFF